jgi:deazaflavin-dependent oxidoreductase (nitroreductase family)
MTDGTATGSKPRGITRFLLRLPIWLYRLRLGWLLGDRFLMFRHTGRKSGLPRYTVVEVVRHDEATGSYVIASGWGEGSDWFRNIQKNPEVVLHTGRRRAPARAERLSHDEAAAELQGVRGTPPPGVPGPHSHDGRGGVGGHGGGEPAAGAGRARREDDAVHSTRLK